MLEIGGLDLENVVSFESLSVDFGKPLTYVRGRNEDSSKLNPTSNGAGKTLLFSTLANVFLDSTPLSIKKRSSKDILKSKNSSIGIPIRDNAGDDWEIIQTAKGYQIFKNGEDQQVRTKEFARQLIEKIFPLSDTEVYSCVYLTTQKPHPIQNFSDSDRLSNFVRLFRLDQYGKIQQYFAVKAREVKDKEIELQTLEQQHLSLSKKLKALESTVGKEDYKKARSKSEELDNKIGKLNNDRIDLGREIDVLNKLLEIESNLEAYRKDYKFSKVPAVMLEILEAKRDLARKWQLYEERNTEYKTRKDTLTSKLEKLVGVRSENAIEQDKNKYKKEFKLLEKHLDELDEQRKSAKEYEQKRESLLEELKAFDSSVVKRAKSIDTQKLLNQKGLHENTLQLKTLLHKHVDGKCPTCDSKIDIKVISRLVSKAAQALNEIETLLKVAKVLDKGKALVKVDFDEDHYAKQKKKYNKLEKFFESLEEEEKTLGLKTKYELELKELKKPKSPEEENPGDPEELEKQIKLCNKIEREINAKSALLKGHSDLTKIKGLRVLKEKYNAIELKIAAIDEEVKTLGVKKSKFAQVVDTYNHYVSSKSVYESELLAVDKKIKKIGKLAKRKKILNLLTKAYGPKGLRALAVDKVCRLFEQNLNFYTDYIFAERFSFTVKASQKGVSILVDRKKGRPDDVSDVRHLSGAESNNFRLLCLVALLPIIPNERRVNILILDEPTSHMCPVSRQKFNESFLPILREVVPSIYIITPHEDDVRDDACEWLITKRDGRSSLEVLH